VKHVLGLVLLLLPAGVLAQGQEKVIDLRASRPPSGNTFEMLWGAYRKADKAGDLETAAKALREIRRLRNERNIRSLEVIGVAFVAEGQDEFKKGAPDRAAQDFRSAISVDPHLPDAYFGLAQAEAKGGLFGFLGAVGDTVSAFTARLDTSRGEYDLASLLVPVILLAALLTASVVAVALLLRDGPLLLHDLEESLALFRGRAFALSVFGVLLLLPTLSFQGYAWLPFWWLALLFVYLSRTERTVTVLILLALAAVAPLTNVLTDLLVADQNPVFRASMLAVEAGPDPRAIDELERATAKTLDDRDLEYLLAIEYKKAGQYDAAADLYRQMIERNKDDGIALNNLGNIEFARGAFQAAVARYKQGIDNGAPPEVLATFNYNLWLAYLQRFERQPALEARLQAERLASSLVRTYDGLWNYENSNAVVDLGLSREQVWAKFEGLASGTGRKNLAGRNVSLLDNLDLSRGAFNRFVAFPLVFVVVVLVVSQWRGRKMFTMRCLKCGTPFCKRCHLGAASAGLCTQCHHLFVVRDGVSGPARNQKLLEVQKEDERRERIFRVLSLVSPGAGHVYAQKTLSGVAFSFAWYAIIVLLLLAGRVFPVTEAPSTLAVRWVWILAAVVILALYVAANRARPDFEMNVPAPRPGRRDVRT
jgi:tetratricopeptide (TPR) repeat protein